MTEEQNYEDVDISDIMDDAEHYPDSDHQTEFRNTETPDLENQHSVQSSEILNTEEQVGDKKAQRNEVIRSTKLPMARIKNIMKMDPDVSVVSSDAIFVVTKATELFLETIAKETYAYTTTNKRKVISKKDLDLVINKVDCLCFLEGAMDF